MTRRFFDHDPFTGQTEYFHFDHAANTFSIETVQDVEPILNANKRAQNDGDGYSKSRDLRYVAEIPLNVLELWKAKYGIDWQNPNHAQGVKRLLNDPDWRYLRTSPGVF